MTTIDQEASIPEWQRDLDQVGFVRRLLLARKWYGADWWFAAFSSALLLFIFSMAFFPGVYAPHNPRVEVGPALLAPGELPPAFVLAGPTDGVLTLNDMTGRDSRIGIVRGSQSAQVLREVVEVRQAELQEEDSDIILRPRNERYDTIDEAVAALDAGEVPVIVGLQSEIEPLIEDNPNLVIGEAIAGTNQGSFALGTNPLGQDLLSRIIWGTRIALLVGFSSALFALVIGVPLGLIAGFWSGRLERALTLVMDSLYSFPGLILAIAITAVLGPGIFNVMLAIAVLYIPTYYRIVRSQTLAVKEELYVEAARSLGAKPFNILARYVFPNVIPSVTVIFSVNVADSILTEAGLSFLGLGLPPDTPDWGIDLASGQDLLRQAPWLVTYPGLMIVITVLGFSMFGESLSEILNPRLREN